MPKEDTQFQPGNPGGPGRPPGTVSLKTMLRKKLAEAIDGDVKERTYSEALIDATIRDALKGDASARKLVWEYIDGKVADKTELTGKDGGPVVISHKYDSIEEADAALAALNEEYEQLCNAVPQD